MLKAGPSLIVAVVAGIVLFTSGCAKGGEQNPAPSNSGSGTQNSNEPQQSRALYAQQTARGDVERAGMAVEAALASAGTGKWQETVNSLESAAEQIANITTADRPDQKQAVRLQPEIDEIKGLLETALNSARKHDAETKAQIVRAHTAIGALKTKMG